MSVIYFLIPIAIAFTAIAIYMFFWAVKTEQFDDLEKQGMSILFDDDDQQPTNKKMLDTAPVDQSSAVPPINGDRVETPSKTADNDPSSPG